MRNDEVELQIQQLKLPVNHLNYISALHAKSLYLIMPHLSPSPTQSMHVYSFVNHSWSLASLGFDSNKGPAYFPKIDSARAFSPPFLYFFGGSDGVGQYDNRLSKLNLETRAWHVDIDHKNQNYYNNPAPQARRNGSLVCHKGKHLVLFGGELATHAESNVNLWLFNLNECAWLGFQNLEIPMYRKHSLCSVDDQIYLFGSKHGEMFSHIVEIDLELDDEKDKPTLGISRVNVIKSSGESCPPSTNHSHIIAGINKSLVVFIQEISSQPRTQIWLFDRLTENWNRHLTVVDYNTTSVLQPEKGIYYMLGKHEGYEKLSTIRLDVDIVKEVLDKIRFKTWKSCEICYDTLINKNLMMEPAFKISYELLSSITEKIDFPFASFAIFAENCYSHSATYMSIKYSKFSEKPMLTIEDDARLNYSNQELEEIIVNFEIDVNFSFHSVDRRIRSLQQKEYIKKQFGTNLKIAAMRLGSEMLYISVSNNYQARVAYFTLQDGEYVCYFYAFDEKTGKLLDQYSVDTKVYVEQKFGQLLKECLHAYSGTLRTTPYKNTLYIFGLKEIYNEKGDLIPELMPLEMEDDRDILYSSLSQSSLGTYLGRVHPVNQIIDISLCCYMGNLFMKNEQMKMYLQVGDLKKTIKKQDYDFNDRNYGLKFLNTSELIKGFDLKSADLIYSPWVNKKMDSSYTNGILLYFKGRLIKRFEIDFGDLSNVSQMEKPFLSYFLVSGRIELPDSLEVNQQKTDFVNGMMMEKLYSKLKQITEIMTKNFESEDKQALFKEGYKLRSREEDENRYPAPTRKSKRNKDDDSYNGL